VKAAVPLLEKLSELEGVTYSRVILHAQRLGTWTEGRIFPGGMVDVGPAASDESIAFVECSPDLQRTQLFAKPRSRQLREEAELLESEATKLEAECA
jgi:hypothetical protein